MSFNRKQALPQRRNGKGKKPFQSQLSIALLHSISENEIIHILMYFTETRQVGLEQESAKYGNATKKGQTSNISQDPLG